MEGAMFDRFVMFYPFEAERVISWKEFGNNSIIAILDNGTTVEYNDLLRTIRNIIPYDGSEESWKIEFSHKLVTKMAERGFDQTRLSEASGVSQQSISLYIHRKKIPTAYTVSKLANALSCSPSDLTDF